MKTELSIETEKEIKKEEKRLKKAKRHGFHSMASYLEDKMMTWALMAACSMLDNKVIVPEHELYYMAGSVSPKNVVNYSKHKKNI